MSKEEQHEQEALPRSPDAGPQADVRKVVSGGQTGADRAALDAAIQAGVAHGGWCPKGRRAEDGRVPARYSLKETGAAQYPVRTRWNVRDSDATVLVTPGTPRGGSALTAEIARKLGKPLCHVDMSTTSVDEAALALREFCVANTVRTLNVAGSRASTCPAIARFTKALVLRLLGK